MPESSSNGRYHLTGDVSERAELLNGSIQLALDGAASHQTERWQLAISLAWRLGREGAIPLEEGDLALDDSGATASEVIALLDTGTADEDTDTGNAVVEATFTIEESNIAGFDAGAKLSCQFDVGAERWTGAMLLGTVED